MNARDDSIRDAIREAHDRAVAQGESGYFDPETGLFVFTSVALAAKGECCDSGCRHCPYPLAPAPDAEPSHTERPHTAAAGRRWRIATRVVLALLAAGLVVLAATGVWLWFRYRPTAAAAWPGVSGGSRSEGWIRTTHRVAGALVVALALAAFVLLVGARLRTGARGVVAGVGVLVTAAAAGFTGRLLPWDQLALWAVTVGNGIGGTQVVFRYDVKYVIVDGHEVSPGTYRFWAVAHVVLGVLVAVTVVLAWMRARVWASRRAVSPSPPPTPESVPRG